MWFCLCDPVFSRFSGTPTCDRQTQTDRHRPMASTALAQHRPVKNYASCAVFDIKRVICQKLLIFSARCYASAVLAMGLCPSVSVTSRSSTKTAKRRITQITPHDSPGTRFLKPKISAKFYRSHPLRGRQMQVGWAGYISKTAKDRHIVSIKVE